MGALVAEDQGAEAGQGRAGEHACDGAARLASAAETNAARRWRITRRIVPAGSAGGMAVAPGGRSYVLMSANGSESRMHPPRACACRWEVGRGIWAGETKPGWAGRSRESPDVAIDLARGLRYPVARVPPGASTRLDTTEGK